MSRRILFLLMALLPGLCLGQVYKSVGPDGKVTYGDTPPSAAGRVDQRADIRARPPRADEDPLSAAMSVYVKVTLVEEFYRFCRDEVPSTEPDVLRARNQWNEQNSALQERVKEVVNDRYTTRELLKIANETESANLAIVSKLRSAPAQEKSAWCRQAPANIASIEMNPSRNPTLVKTLLNYKPKPRP